MSATDTHTKALRPENGEGDVSGLRRMTGNVLTTWAAYLVYLVAGFLLPRMIDRRVGQTALGVWDFGWSLVAYFTLVQGGVISSINRYVAKYRSANSSEGINRAVSSVTLVLLVMSVVVVILAACVAAAVPGLLAGKLKGHVGDAQWVVLLLGMSLAAQMAFSGASGVVTGCHRWGLQNAITAGSYAAAVSGMVVCMLLGGGLPWLAFMELCGQLLAGGISLAAAFRVCPGLRIRPSLASWREARVMLLFGGKSFVPSIAELLLNQTVSVLVMMYLGPELLALYARPRSLLRHVAIIVKKYSFVLIPSASALKATGQQSQLRDLFLKATRYGAYIALPMIAMLAILGDSVLYVWMGGRYQQGLLLAVLAMGELASIIQRPAAGILGGMNLHGRPGLAMLGAAVCAVPLTCLVLEPLHWGLIGVAIASTAPVALIYGLYLPIYAGRQLKIGLRRLAVESMGGPVLCCMPFCACLIGARLLFPGKPVPMFLWGSIAGGVVLAFLYWRHVVPIGIRSRVRRMIGLNSV